MPTRISLVLVGLILSYIWIVLIRRLYHLRLIAMIFRPQVYIIRFGIGLIGSVLPFGRTNPFEMADRDDRIDQIEGRTFAINLILTVIYVITVVKFWQ